MIEVAALAAPDEDGWDDFLRATKGGLLYHSIRYRDLLLEHLGCDAEYLVAREAGEIRGLLPLMWSGASGSRVLNSLPFYGSHGAPVAVSPPAEMALTEAWNERATDAGTLAATMVANPFLDHELPPPVHTMTDGRISQVTPLSEAVDPAAVLALAESSARRNARKAERSGIEVGIDNSALPDLYRIHHDNIEAIGGLAKSEGFFLAVPRHFRPGEDYDVWVARLHGAVIAGLLVFYFGRTAEYFTPATEHEHRAEQPLALILAAAMSHAHTRGCALWNWGGTWSDQDGVYRFKRKWGAQAGSYTYYVQVNDETLLDSWPEELRERFGHFYVAPFGALRGRD